MRCADIRNLASDFVDHELDGSTRAAVAAHLESCEGCVRHVAALREMVEALRTVPRPRPPSDLATATLVALDREIEPAMTIVTRRHHRLRPHFIGSPIAVCLQWLADHEFRMVSFGFGAAASAIVFAAMLAAIRPAMSVEPFIPVSDRLIWMSAEEGRALDPDQRPGRRTLPRVPDDGFVPAIAPSAERGENEDLVVLADISADGRASIVEVLSGPSDDATMLQLATAFNRPRSFIPARASSGRPVATRVVLYLGRVDIIG